MTRQEEFINKIAPYAQKEYKKGKLILPSVCIAQACKETGFGNSKLMVSTNGYFGIKVGKSAYKFGNAWKGKSYYAGTTEYYDGKNATKIKDHFRAYDTLEDSVTDYYDMLCTASRYKKAVGAKTSLDTITAIKNGGYATAPDYVAGIMSIIMLYKLDRYNTEDAIEPEPKAPFEIGKTYCTQVDLWIRVSPMGSKTPFEKLTANAKQHATYKPDGAILNRCTKVTVKDIREHNGAIWVRIPSGWICGITAKGERYIK